MFTQPAPPSPGILSPASATATISTTTPGRTSSRLRGLNYLRNYTQTHILSRDSGSNSANSHRNQASGPVSVPVTVTIPAATASQSGPPAQSRNPSLTRANTYSPPARSQRIQRFASTNTIDYIHSDIASVITPTDISSTNSDPNSTESSSDPHLDSDLGHGKSEAKAARKRGPKTDPISDGPDMTRTRSATTGDLSHEMLPSLRLSAYYDPRSNRQSLSFTPVSRTLPTGSEIIKVGRYSERENHAAVPANTPSAAPVGFKSKVVSRRHCEFYFENNKWFIKDVKSSSGTFLNHIRLSPPGTESKPFPINDGDIVQLGIDFRGGEEMIFRCVKMRIELNRGWQAKPNTFNMATHKRLRNMTSAASTASHAQDCSICLNAIAPCQSLFVAPCSHTWHYKCIRELLVGPSWPIFTCPNCRAAADLDADVEEPSEEWQQLDSGAEDVVEEPIATEASPPSNAASTPDSTHDASSAERDSFVSVTSGPSDAADRTVLLDSPAVEQQRHTSSRYTTSNPVSIPSPARPPNNGTLSANRGTRTPSPNGQPLVVGHEGPMTPRNDAGPWVFDGDAGRASQEASRQGISLDGAAAPVENPA
ncbi:uncharacterized protein BCR38DRAFT_89773 [Pseudomassariella vexata]|uniref:RING-type E3 ubiquitin transferase n=1 Tax=Pseudomassariella vexata TaxID=1141098 RepID=A0A1Y2EDK5_9PEZI|nr:uncharacterized protein BCR38DRAFT_89773 [Pseudomassariella vexata]ORY69663.1 hypothetical protein BCR38DRAFT_89773 [Pseudomassariella vexata]